MAQESSVAGPLALWITRLQQKVDTLEQASMAAEDKQKLWKEIDTCDTYWKKIYVRAKDFVFSTPQGAQIAQDLAHIQEQLTRIRQTAHRREAWNPLSWEQWSTL